MKFKDIITGLKAEYQGYTESIDIIKRYVLEATSSWATDPEVIVEGPWESILKIKVEIQVTDKTTGAKVTIPLQSLMKGEKIERSKLLRK